MSCVCRDPTFGIVRFQWIARSFGDPQLTMSTQPQPQADRERLAPGFGIVDSDPLTIHNPDRGIVIDIVDRTESRVERTLTDTYRYRVEVAQEQETEYRGVFHDYGTAEQKAYGLTHDL